MPAHPQFEDMIQSSVEEGRSWALYPPLIRNRRHVYTTKMFTKTPCRHNFGNVTAEEAP